MHLVRCVSELSHISLPQFPVSASRWQQPTVAMITEQLHSLCVVSPLKGTFTYHLIISHLVTQ